MTDGFAAGACVIRNYQSKAVLHLVGAKEEEGEGEEGNLHRTSQAMRVITSKKNKISYREQIWWIEPLAEIDFSTAKGETVYSITNIPYKMSLDTKSGESTCSIKQNIKHVVINVPFANSTVATETSFFTPTSYTAVANPGSADQTQMWVFRRLEGFM